MHKRNQNLFLFRYHIKMLKHQPSQCVHITFIAHCGAYHLHGYRLIQTDAHTHTERETEWNGISQCCSHSLSLPSQQDSAAWATKSQRDAISTSNFTLIKLFEFLIWARLYCRHRRHTITFLLCKVQFSLSTGIAAEWIWSTKEHNRKKTERTHTHTIRAYFYGNLMMIFLPSSE